MTVAVLDELLALRAQRGDELAMQALVVRYERLLRVWASNYFAGGLDADDLYQEATIGLWAAVRDYRADKQVGSWRSWAELCVARRLITAVKTAQRAKHSPLNDGVLLSVPVRARDEGGPDFAGTLGDVLSDARRDPHAELVNRDDFRGLVDFFKGELSELERFALVGLLNGESYAETEARLQETEEANRPGRARYSPVKVVDNALSRARRKARFYMQERDAA